MLNATSSVSVMPYQQNVSGKIHYRNDELQTLRRALNVGHDGMISALNTHDYESYQHWSELIDDTQARIDRVIDKEDDYSKQKLDNREKASKTRINTMDGYLGVTDHAIDVVEKAAGPISKLNFLL